MSQKDNHAVRMPHLYEVLILFALFISGIFFFVYKLNLPIPLVLFLFWFLVIILGKRLGHDYPQLQGAIIRGISGGLDSILILITVGTVMGAWICGGVIPSIIFYGLKLIHPSYFLLISVLLSTVTSIAIGTSWGTVGTVGVALMGIGTGLGVPAPLIAGSILSGAYFGDKLSPLSDSTLLTASMCKVPVMEHIRSMLYIDVPAYTLTLILFFIMGFNYSHGDVNLDKINEITMVLNESFVVSPLILFPPLLVISLLFFKFPALPSMVIGAVAGGILAVFVQGFDLAYVFNIAYSGFKINTSVKFIDVLLSRGGMEGMLSSVIVILMGLGLGGLLEFIKALEVLFTKMTNMIESYFMLTFSTIFVGFLGNVFGCAMYVSLIMTPKIMEKRYIELKYDRKILSRNTEIGGTLTSGMVPWSDNGLYMTTILGVSVFEYLPFMWLSFSTILFALLFSLTNQFNFRKV